MCNNAIILYMPKYSSEIFLLPISITCIRRTLPELEDVPDSSACQGLTSWTASPTSSTSENAHLDSISIDSEIPNIKN